MSFPNQYNNGKVVTSSPNKVTRAGEAGIASHFHVQQPVQYQKPIKHFTTNELLDLIRKNITNETIIKTFEKCGFGGADFCDPSFNEEAFDEKAKKEHGLTIH